MSSVRRARAAGACVRGPGGDGLVGDGHARGGRRGSGPSAFGAVGLEVDAVARGVGGPLAADVGGGSDDRDALDAAARQQVVGDAQPEGGLAGGGRGGREEAAVGLGEQPLERLALPCAQRPGGGPRRNAGGSERCGGGLHRGAAGCHPGPTDR